MSMNRDAKLKSKMQSMTSAIKGKQTNTMKLPALERMTNSIKTTADTKSGRGSLNGGNVTPTVKTAPRQSVREHSISGVNISKQKRQNIGLTKTPKTSIAAQKPTKKDKNYIVKRDRYDELMQDNGLANDIKTLAEVNYNNANQDATVSKEWAEEYGAKAITGGLNKKQYLESLSRRYNLTPKELEDMALTFHSDANKEEVADYGEGLKEFAEEHPVLGSAGSFVGTLGSGIEGMYNVLAGGITGDDRYLSNMFQTTKKSPREGAKENIDSGIGKGAYDIGMGIGDMAAGATTGSAPAILAGNTANEALESSLDRNNSVRQASIYGAGAGALDYITESIGLGKADDLAVNGLKQAGLKQFLKNSAKAGKEELTENVIQNIGQQVLDAIVNDENSELNLSYRNKLANGEDVISAFLNTAKEYSAQLGFDALLGYGMGSFMQGGASILPALSGMINNKISGVDTGKIPTEDVEIQKIAQDYQNAADEMARLQSQLPKVEGPTDGQLSPEEVKVLQDVVDGKYDIPETGETAPANIAEQTPKNPTITSEPIEGADQAKARHKELSKQLVDLNKEIAKQKELFDSLEDKKSKGAERKAAGQKLAEMQKQAKAIQREKSELSYQMKGEERPYKRYMQDYDKDAYNAIYGQNGIMGKLDYATHFAGDTPEAIALRDEIKKIINDTVQSGEFPDEADIWNKVEQLDNMARTTKQPFTSKKGKNYDYDTFFAPSNTDEYSGLNMDVLNGYHSALRSHSNKAVTDRITDALNSDTFNPVTITGDNGQQYRIEKGDNGLNLVTLGEDGNPTWVDNFKDSKALLNKFNKVERDGTKLIDDALQETQAPTEGTPQITETPNEMPTVKPTEQAQPENNMPALEGVIPKNNTTANEPPKTDISQRYETLKKSDLFTKSEANMKMLETAKEQGVFDKDVEGRKVTQEEALKDYLNNKEEVTERNFSRKWDSGKDVDTAMLILNDMLEEGDQTKVNLALLKQAEQSKGAGRLLRANRDYVGTKEGTLAKAGEFLNDKADKVLSSRKTKEQFDAIAERIINGDLSDLSSKFDMDDADIQNIKDALGEGAGKADIAKMIAMYKAVGKTGISPDALQKIQDIYKEIDSQKLNPNSKKRADLEADAFKVLAQDIGGKRSWKEKWDAWRYLAMLGNPKTHLRNVLGNTTHYMVTEAKDNMAAAMEGVVDKASKKGIDRTKAILSPKDRGLVKASAQDADDVAYSALNDSGNKYNVKDEISRARDSFNSKTLSKLDQLNSKALDLEDYSALKRKYSKALARYLKANGADEGIFKSSNEADTALLDKARNYAIDQAKQATFHEYSKMAESLNHFSKKLSEGNAAEKVSAMALEGVLPFKKTPINILKQGIKYSPVSLAKAVTKTIDAVRTGNSSASDAIDSLASGLTGSAIMALGGFLAHQGLLTGAANENYDVDNAETEQGAQNYALKIGNKSYTLDWLAPSSLPLFVGTELYNMMAEGAGEDEDMLDKFVTSLSTIAEPVTEMSMLQGIQNMLNELSYSKENVFGTLLANTTLGYASQGIPTVAGQFARAIDPTRRSTYTDKNVGIKRQFDKTTQKIKNKIPFLSKEQEPYIDTRGREQTNEGVFTHFLGNNFGTRLADQMLSPGYFKNGTVTDVDKELNRLYEETGENVYKNVSSGKVDQQKLSKENFTKYQRLYGSTNDILYNDIIGSDDYNKMDDAERVKAIDSIKSVSRMIADHEIGGRELKDSEQKVYDLYKTKGLDGISQYIKDSTKAKSLDMKYDTYIKQKSEYQGGAEQYAKDKEKADALGITVDQYNKNQNYSGGIQKFAQDNAALKKINEQYGTEFNMKTVEKYGVEGTKQRAEDAQTAKEYGYVQKDGDVNYDSYYKGKEIVGDSPTALKAYSDFHSKGYKKNVDMVPALRDNSNFSADQKGKIIMAEHSYKYDDLGKTAKGAYDVGGTAGVYYYYMLKDYADANRDGSLNKNERAALRKFMQSDSPYVTQIPDDVFYYLGSAKW